MGQEIQLLPRTFEFSVQVIYFVNKLPRTASGSTLGGQLVRCATSVGANIEEGQAASSRKDFIQKYYIALREIRESNYWLRLIDATYPELHNSLKHLLSESSQLQLILGAIIRNTKARSTL